MAAARAVPLNVGPTHFLDQRVTHLASEINSASAEQASGIVQIGAAVNMLDTMTQQNAALIAQSAASAASLEQQARHLTEAGPRFDFDVEVRRYLAVVSLVFTLSSSNRSCV